MVARRFLAAVSLVLTDSHSPTPSPPGVAAAATVIRDDCITATAASVAAIVSAYRYSLTS